MQTALRRLSSPIRRLVSCTGNLRSAVISDCGRYADQATFDQLRSLGKAASSTEDKLRFYYALANAQEAPFIEQNVKIALTDEISNGRVNRFLIQLAVQSNDPELVWKTVLAERAPISHKTARGSRRTDALCDRTGVFRSGRRAGAL